VAIVCALHEPEFSAVVRELGGAERWRDSSVAGVDHQYLETDFARSSGAPLRIVAGVPSYMGLTATAVLSTQMLFLFRPRLLLMIGIAAGMTTGKQDFGDILVADPSVDFASGKLTELAGQELFQPDSRPLSLPTHLSTLLKELGRKRTWLDDIAEQWPAKKPNSRLKVHVGPVGASDRVISSAKQVKAVHQQWRKAVGLEMETYALYRAAVEAPGPKPTYLSLKAVCDHAVKKKDDWQEYAAYVAAAYAAHLIRDQWPKIVK